MQLAGSLSCNKDRLGRLGYPLTLHPETYQPFFGPVLRVQLPSADVASICAGFLCNLLYTGTDLMFSLLFMLLCPRLYLGFGNIGWQRTVHHGMPVMGRTRRVWPRNSRYAMPFHLSVVRCRRCGHRHHADQARQTATKKNSRILVTVIVQPTKQKKAASKNNNLLVPNSI